MTSEPKRTLWSTGASIVETRAVILSSPWRTATVSARAGSAASASTPQPALRNRFKTYLFYKDFQYLLIFFEELT